MKEGTNVKKPVAKAAVEVGPAADKDVVGPAKRTRRTGTTAVRKAAKPTAQRKSSAGGRRRGATSAASGVQTASSVAEEQDLIRGYTDALTVLGYVVMPKAAHSKLVRANDAAQNTLETYGMRLDIQRDMITERDQSINRWKAVSASLLIVAVLVAIWG